MGLSNTHFSSMRAVGQLAPRIHINQSRILNLLIKPSHFFFFFCLQYISRSQYVCYSCEQGWEGDRGRGNKGLMSLAKRGWRLRQMAWSLQHSGVARLVLKSSSLTFQQILPGGCGVCHTTPRIHTALLTPPHPPTPTSNPLPKKKILLPLLCRPGPTEHLTTPFHIPAFLSSHMYAFTQ